MKIPKGDEDKAFEAAKKVLINEAKKIKIKDEYDLQDLENDILDMAKFDKES